jgi:hypothetical protein
VLAIFSSNSVAKEWPLTEVNTALALEVSGEKTVVPLIVGKPDLGRLPLIRGKDYLVWKGDPQHVAAALRQIVAQPSPEQRGPQPGRPAAGASSVPAVAAMTRASAATEQRRSWLRRVFGRPR